MHKCRVRSTVYWVVLLLLLAGCTVLDSQPTDFIDPGLDGVIAMEFNGNQRQFINMGNVDLNPGEAFTVMGWGTSGRRSGSGVHRIIGKGRGGVDGEWYLAGEGARLVTAEDDRVDIDTGVHHLYWHHVVMSFDSEVIRVYLNGELIEEKPHAGDVKKTNYPLVIGAAGPTSQWGTNSFWEYDGLIYDVRMYDRKLSDAEIAHIYELEGQDDITDGMQGRWIADEEREDGEIATGSGSVLDVSGNENHGTPVNAPVYRRVVIGDQQQVAALWSQRNLIQPGSSILECDQVPDYGGEESFSLAFMADTQYVTENWPHIYESMTQWIADNAEAKNIRFVLHGGDVIENYNDEDEFQIAVNAMSNLWDRVPYAIALGNHDFVNWQPRDTTLFNTHFPVSRYQYLPTFGGVFEEDMLDNTYHLFSAGDEDYLILALEFGPRDEVLVWANTVAEAYPERKIIVVTHSYLHHDATHVAPGDRGNPKNYRYSDYQTVNDGADMWEKFVRRHENMFMVLSGHRTHPDIEYRIDLGDAGNPVYQFLANPQGLAAGGFGLMMFMEFIPSLDLIAIRYYSPYMDGYWQATNQFYVDLGEVAFINCHRE